MKTLATLFLLAASLLLRAADAPADSCNHQLYYTSPAAIWEETLPLGNGRLGMMPDGGILREHIVLNEISLWSGMEADYSNPDASKSLPAIRQLLFEGKNREAQELMYSSFVPKKQETDGRYGTYQVLGDLDIDFTYNSSLSILNSPLNNYRRWLNLRDAVAYTAFRLEDVDYRREYFVSRDRDVMLIHLVAGHEGTLNFSARLSRAEHSLVTVQGNTLLMDGMLESGKPGLDGMKYRVAMQLVQNGGESSVSPGNGICLKNGQEAWLILLPLPPMPLPVQTSRANAMRNLRQLAPSFHHPANSPCSIFHSSLSNHVTAHRFLYDRVSLTLPATPDDTLPTNERILRFTQQESPALAALYYNYGRYLLISSTRPGSLPPNLQGLWANGVSTPWNGDYHTNINIQMNHWPLETSRSFRTLSTVDNVDGAPCPFGRSKCAYFLWR